MNSVGMFEVGDDMEIDSDVKSYAKSSSKGFVSDPVKESNDIRGSGDLTENSNIRGNPPRKSPRSIQELTTKRISKVFEIEINSEDSEDDDDMKSHNGEDPQEMVGAIFKSSQDYISMSTCLKAISDIKETYLNLTAQLNLKEFLNLPWSIQPVESQISQFIMNFDRTKQETMVEGRWISLKDGDLGRIFCLQTGRLQMKYGLFGSNKSRSFLRRWDGSGFHLSDAASVEYRTWFEFLQTTFRIKSLRRPLPVSFVTWVETEANDIVGQHDTQTVFAKSFWNELQRLQFQKKRAEVRTLIGVHIAIILQDFQVAGEKEANLQPENMAKDGDESTLDVQHESITLSRKSTPPQLEQKIGVDPKLSTKSDSPSGTTPSEVSFPLHIEAKNAAKVLEQIVEQFYLNGSSLSEACTVHERVRNLERERWKEEREALQASLNQALEEKAQLQQEKDRVEAKRDEYFEIWKKTDRKYLKAKRKLFRGTTTSGK